MKRIGRKVAVLCGISLCALLTLTTNSLSVCANEINPTETSAEPRYTNLEWVYATIDGVLMMRLYNHSTGEWVGDWIPAVGEPENPAN